MTTTPTLPPLLTDSDLLAAMMGPGPHMQEGYPFLLGDAEFIEAGRAIEAAVLAKLQERSCSTE